jgi:hypothetical protein
VQDLFFSERCINYRIASNTKALQKQSGYQVAIIQAIYCLGELKMFVQLTGMAQTQWRVGYCKWYQICLPAKFSLQVKRF